MAKATVKRRPIRREMKIGLEQSRLFLALPGEMDYQQPPKYISYYGNKYTFHKRLLLRRATLKEVKKLRTQGYIVKVFEIRRGRWVVDHLIYKYKK